jgi:hypothetical protein
MDQTQPADRAHRPVRGVFLGPVEIAGYFARLRVGFESLGVRTLYVDLSDHAFSYAESPPAPFEVRATMAANRRLEERSPGRAFWKAVSIGARALLLARALLTCDAFVFGSGHTLFGRRELRLIRMLGKKVIVVFFGSEVRPSYLDGVETAASIPTRARFAELNRQKRHRILELERHATAIISHPAMSQLLRRPYVSWLEIGIPTMPVEPPQREPRNTVRILHAPSHADAKGTDVIRGTIARLAEGGMKIDYTELQSTTNARVRDALLDADVVIDQLYADTPMAVLASEAAGAGIAALVGSLDWDPILADAHPDSIPPTVRCTPEAFEATLRELVESEPRRQSAGEQAREFVRTRWRPEHVAGRYLALIRGATPSQWLRTPSAVRYASGAGLSRERLRANLRLMASRSDDPFDVRDKPALERRLLALAEGDPEVPDGSRADEPDDPRRGLRPRVNG